MNARNQRLCALSAFVMLALAVTGLLTAGFLPLPSPSMSAPDEAALLTEDTLRIRLGLVLMTIGAVFLGPYISVLTVQLRRVEGPHSPLSWLVLAFGTLSVFEFILPLFVALAAAYRPERSPEVTQALFDLCWLMFIGLVSTPVLQAFVIAWVILGDRRAEPVFPRWVGMFNIFTGLALSGGFAVPFFKTGALAWTGVIAFWLPLSVLGCWMMVMVWSLLRDGDAQERDIAPESDLHRRAESLADQVASLRADCSIGRA